MWWYEGIESGDHGKSSPVALSGISLLPDASQDDSKMVVRVPGIGRRGALFFPSFESVDGAQNRFDLFLPSVVGNFPRDLWTGVNRFADNIDLAHCSVG